MAFAIQYHVGAKYGSWFTGNDRFASRASAQKAIAELRDAVTYSDAVSYTTARVVELADRKEG